MLLPRVITAVLLLAVLLPTLVAASAWPFAVVTLVLIAAAGWEWSRLNGVAPIAALGPAALLAVAGAWAVYTGSATRVPPSWWWGVTTAWVVGGAFALRAGPLGWPRAPAALRLLLGLLLLWAGWLALVQARSTSINFVLSSLCIVWVADIAAYAAGRAFGRRKLAPTISPGKSWEGVAGGVLGVWVLGLVWTSWIDARAPVDGPSLFSLLIDRLGWAGFFVLSTALAGLSVVGDLFESLVKRAAGAKDSSRLLPGHGGVLDRIDALLPVLPAALALAAL
ncbi:MAG TPA: phosphatidate cytidylyltransferase [Burkholderiaceae bacterium]|nr:phosphatidate cytidylyltransferase [Burkholderiaceae bacterium]